MDDPVDVLLTEADTLCQSAAFREVIWRHHRYRREDGSLKSLSTRIHPQDQMLRHSLRHWKEVNRSVSQYFSVALQQHDAQQQLLRLLFNGRSESLAILDFACGFGRSLRFLMQSAVRAEVWASDVQHEAVDFVAQEFGANGLHSSFHPSEFQPERAFDFIWVASFFSHLPEHLFRAWLKSLSSLLTARGVLCFSVHDECLLPTDATLPPSGIHFTPASEIEELDNRAYGTSHVSESFVQSAIAHAVENTQTNYVRLRRGLAHEQDLYVVAPDIATDLRPLRRFRRGTWGCLDRYDISAASDVRLQGWAGSFDDGVAQAAVTLNGVTYHCPTGLSREDVRSVLRDDRFGQSGWELAAAIEGHNVFLEVSAESAAGERALLFAGPVRGAQNANGAATA